MEVPACGSNPTTDQRILGRFIIPYVRSRTAPTPLAGSAIPVEPPILG